MYSQYEVCKKKGEIIYTYFVRRTRYDFLFSKFFSLTPTVMCVILKK